MSETSPEPHAYVDLEQRLNSVTHAIGTGLAIAATVTLLVVVVPGRDAAKIAAFAVYGLCQIVLFSSSTLLHTFHDKPRLLAVFRPMDYSSIYLLIAGTYTPVALVAIGGTPGWFLFGIEWFLAIVGVVLRSGRFAGPNALLDLLYLPMGWMIVLFIRPILVSVEPAFFIWAVVGGLSYSIGIVFYFLERVPLAHVVWHLFVLSGAASFFAAFLLFLV